MTTNDGRPSGPVIPTVAGPERTADLAGSSGTRYLTRTRPLADGEAAPAQASALSAALDARRLPGEALAVARIAVPSGVSSGSTSGLVRLPLGEQRMDRDTSVDRWSVTAIAIDDRGEAADPVVAVVSRDVIPPGLDVPVPMTAAIWPFAASLGGSTESDAVVTVDGVRPDELDDSGRFTFQRVLAPWPQTIRVAATDPSGNVTEREISIVGGVDYRQFPWAAIATVAVLLVVAVTGVVGARRGGLAADTDPGVADRTYARPSDRGGRLTRGAFGDDPRPEIEDLPPGTGL